MPLEGLSFGTIWNYLRNPIHFFKIWLRSFASVDLPCIFLTINLCNVRHAELRASIFLCQGSFFTRSISETKWVTPIFFTFLTQITHYLTAVGWDGWKGGVDR